MDLQFTELIMSATSQLGLLSMGRGKPFGNRALMYLLLKKHFCLVEI